MTREEAKRDLQALIEYFNEETGATPMCLEYCMNMLEHGFTTDEMRTIKKVLGCANTLYTVMEVINQDSKPNKVDLLLRKIMEAEEWNTRLSGE